MNKRVPVVNSAGDWEESIVQHARHLGQSEIRRAVFNVVYGRGTRPKSKKQIMNQAGLGSEKAQQVQNELDHLSTHHLILKTANDGSVDDRSKYVYAKDDFVRANREAIVRRADNKALADRTSTKRRPAIAMRPLVAQRRELRKRKKLKILYLTSSPDKRDQLRVDLEVRKVQDHIRGSIYRDSIEILVRPAADTDAIIEGLNDHRPQIIHFSGHGSNDGIELDDGRVAAASYRRLSYDLLARAIAATDSPPSVVVLNSCESSGARRHLLDVAPILVTMRTSISDLSATAFAPKFYAALASGQSVKSAFEQGKLAVAIVSLTEKDTPELHCTPSKNPSKVILT